MERNFRLDYGSNEEYIKETSPNLTRACLLYILLFLIFFTFCFGKFFGKLHILCIIFAVLAVIFH
jgi:hypothetical protein